MFKTKRTVFNFPITINKQTKGFKIIFNGL